MRRRDDDGSLHDSRSHIQRSPCGRVAFRSDIGYKDLHGGMRP